MKDKRITNLVNLMSKNLTDNEVELLELGKLLKLDLKAFKRLKKSQSESYVEKIRDQALLKMNSINDNKIKRPHLFYIGSVDFMVSIDNKQKKRVFLLETNGGSNRGLSILTNSQQEIIYNGVYHAISQAIREERSSNPNILVLIGIPQGDRLIHEKAILINNLKKKLDSNGYSSSVFSIDNFEPTFQSSIAILVADYKQILDNLSYEKYWLKIRNHKVNVILGDGVVRRFNNPIVNKIIREEPQKLKSIIINPVYHITDDKSLSYLAKCMIDNDLEKYNAADFIFSKAFNKSSLITKVLDLISIYDRPFIIKPYGGSGGVGVMSILPENALNKYEIKRIVENSETEFFERFRERRDPYPYTIQEMAKFSLIDWNREKHTFDVRIYLSQIENKIMPVGGLARIARGTFIKGINKEEFVVNLTGFGGRIEVERGLGLSEENADKIGLSFDDFVNLFSISSMIFDSIVENYRKIIEFNNWNKTLGDKTI